MGIYRDQFIKEMQLRGLSKMTQTSYLRGITNLIRFYGKCPTQINVEEIKDYLLHFKNSKAQGRDHSRSARTVNGHASAIKSFYKLVLKQNLSEDIPRIKPAITTPTILSKSEVKAMIDSVYNVQYKVMIMTLYATGMRSSELLHLKIQDIDSKRMIINIRNGKGARDREAALSPLLLCALRTHWRLKSFKDTHFIFSPTRNRHGGELDKSLEKSSLTYALNTAVKAAGIKKKSPLTF